MITDIERDLMKHAMGFDSATPFYRNHFAAWPGSDNDNQWGHLVIGGYAEVTAVPNDIFPYVFYRVTQKGIDALKEKVEK